MFTATVTTTPEGRLLVQSATTLPVDRKECLGWEFPAKDSALAERLVRAIEAGKVLAFVGVDKDVNGKTYVVASTGVMGRYMNSDLKRLGF